MRDLDPASWTPPDDFVAVPSAVQGVELWGPKPVAEDDDSWAKRSTKCPQCGAAAAFDAGKGALTCRFCGFTEAPRAKAVGTAAEQNEFTLAALAAFDQGWGVERRELHCSDCGANLAIDEGQMTATCPFCSSNHVNVQDATQAGIRPRFVIPFAVRADVLEKNLREFLGRGWMFPSSLSQLARPEKFTGIYLPFWVFDARMDGTWRAQIGHPHTVTYYENGKMRTRTEIRYQWENGAVTDTVRGLLVPGTTKISAKIAQGVEGFDLEALAAYDPSFLAGWRAMTYDLALPEAWDQGRARMREISRASNHGQALGRTGHVRSFTMTADFEDERWRYVLLPMYVSAYTWGGRTWQVLVNGQTGEVAGQKPVAWWRIWTAIALSTTPSLFVGVCLGAPLTLAGGFGVILMVLGLVLFLASLRWGWGLWQRALDAERA